MDNSIYVALSRQAALFRDMDATANNIANANTTGYNSEKVMFTDYLVDDGNRHKIAFAQDISSYRDTKAGPLRTTGNPLDVAIQGPGYFMLETQFGQRYSRAGSFQLDAQGIIVNADGYPVLDDSGGRIQIPPEAQNIKILENGTVMINGAESGAIGIVEFDNPQKMEQLFGTLYSSPENPVPAVRSKLAQGVLEDSNVQAVVEMTHMIEVSRGVSSTAKFIEVMYDLQRQASNTWAQQQ